MPTTNPVVPATADEGVIARAPVDEVGATATDDHVIPAATVDGEALGQPWHVHPDDIVPAAAANLDLTRFGDRSSAHDDAVEHNLQLGWVGRERLHEDQIVEVRRVLVCHDDPGISCQQQPWLEPFTLKPLQIGRTTQTSSTRHGEAPERLEPRARVAVADLKVSDRSASVAR